MYSLELFDNTIISNLQYINETTFEVITDDNSLYFKLTDENLSLALLCEDEMPVDIWMDYTLLNYSSQGGVVRFKVIKKEELEEQMRRKEEKEAEKRRKYNEKMKRRRERR